MRNPATSLIAACCLLVCVAGCHNAPVPPDAKKADAAKPPEPLKAAVVTVGLTEWPTIVRCQGSLVADDQTVLGSRVAGLVRATHVDVGDKVEPGQILVALDDSEFKLQLNAAEAALLQARALIGLKPEDPVSKLDPLNAPPVRETRATLEETRGRRERWQKLRSQNAVTEEELQTLLAAEKVAEARYSSALNGVNSNIAQVAVRTAEVELAKQKISDASIVAPFSGFVQQRSVAAGTFVQIGSPLVTIVRTDSLRFRGTLPERLASQIEFGQAITLSIESFDKPVVAKVTRISPALDMSSRSLTFEALINNSDGELRAGLFAEAEVTIDPHAQAVVVGESSLVEFAGSQKIWKVVDGSAKEQVVRPGRRSDKMVEILDGLKPGDKILVNGSLGRVAVVQPPDEPVSQTAQNSSPNSAPSTKDGRETVVPAPDGQDADTTPATGGAAAAAAAAGKETKDDDKAEPAPSQNAG